jgi:hypothetical protein
VIDSNLYTGRPRLGAGGSLWHGRYPLAPVLRAARFEADQAAQHLATPGVGVVPLVAVHGAQVPRGKLVVDGVAVVTAGWLPALPAVVGPERVAAWPTSPVRLRPAA